MELAGANAVVTGAAVRLGRALARRLAESGMNVVVHYHRHHVDADELVREIESLGVRAVAIGADLERPESSARELFAQAASALGPVTVLVNNAAIFEPGRLADLDAGQWRRHLAINLEAPLFLSHEFAAALPDGQRGQIINIVDWRALHPQPGHLAYTVAKSGLASLTKILAQELGPRIQVNAVAPGAILPAVDALPGQFASLAAQIPMGRTGAPADVTEAVLFLLRADFMTGHVMPVTGGQELIVGGASHE